MNKGKLYIVATPIGNLEDMTIRAIDTLKSVAFILAEDTRETSKLLSHYDIETQMVSYRDQNHERIISKVIEKLNMGLSLALVSDCGTPLISDPGYKLVRDLRESGYDIESIPGASAVTSALSISGLPTDRFLFLGFLPKSDSKRKELIKYVDLDLTLVIYESPNRLERLLQIVKQEIGELHISAIKDMSKKREHIYWGMTSDVISEISRDNLFEQPHGEWVILLSRKV